jgi:Lipase
VTIIHTDGDNFGHFNPLGAVDFYVNYGKDQPGCWDVLDLCSHARSVEYFLESFTDHFTATRCDNLDGIKSMTCTEDSSTEKALMTARTENFHLEGIFYLKTNSKYPFAIY